MLVVFGGPAESGRAALAQAVADEAEAALLSVADGSATDPTDTAAAVAIASGLRAVSGTVVVDIGTATADVRAAWRELALRSSVPFLLVAVARTAPDEATAATGATEATGSAAGSTAPTAADAPWAESHLAIDNVGPERRHVKRVLNAMAALAAPQSPDPDGLPG